MMPPFPHASEKYRNVITLASAGYRSCSGVLLRSTIVLQERFVVHLLFFLNHREDNAMDLQSTAFSIFI